MKDKQQILVVAEACNNHNGNLQIAKDLIIESKRAGCNIVKFQLRDHKLRKDIEDHPWKDILLESRVTKRFLWEIKEECDRNKIEFLCTPFEVDGVKLLEDLNVLKYKIASGNIYDYDLIEAIQKTGKPIIVSMGMLDEKIEPYYDTWTRLEKLNTYFLYCVSKYPASLEDLDLSEDMFSDYQGFSDHTPGISASVMAMSLGARIIEKHVTLDKSMDGPDHSFSLDMQELKQLCSMRDDIERILY